MPARKRREPFGSIRKLPSGRHQASYQGPDGARHNAAATFGTDTEARNWLTGVQARIESGTWKSADAEAADRAKNTTTLGDFAAGWLNTRYTKGGKPLTPRTQAEYRAMLSGALAPLLPMTLPEITRAVVEDWRATILATGKRTSAAHAYGLLSTILKSAVDRGLIETNPCTIRGASTTRTGKVVNPPTLEQFTEMLPHMGPYQTMTLLSAWSGLRFGEVTELRRGDIVMTKAHGKVTMIEVKVTRSVTHVTGVGAIVGQPKTDAGIRDVMLPPAAPGLYDAMIAHMARVPLGKDALLFPGTRGGHVRQSAVNYFWGKARAEVGRPDMPWHALRHFAASQYAAVGATEAEIMARQGQRSPGMVRRYVHTTGREHTLVHKLGVTA